MTERIIIPYRFRSIIDADLPMVERWLKTPEVARWWGDPAEQLVLLKEDLDDPLMRQWIVEYGQRPFAYVQAYEAHAWPQVHLQGLPGGTQVIASRTSRTRSSRLLWGAAAHYGIANDAVHRWSRVRCNQRTGLIQNRVVKSVSHCGEAFTSAVSTRLSIRVE
jgi:hypothetical protein